jgi:hypothetical protein
MEKKSMNFKFQQFNFPWILGTGLILFSFLFFLSCQPKTDDPEDDHYRCAAGQWAQDTSNWYTYGHDPFYSEHFTVYSDGSTNSAKQQLAQLAEEIFGELLEELHVRDIADELQFIPGYTYYIYAEKYLKEIKSMGYRNGFFVPAIDCVTLPGIANDLVEYRYLSKHEMIHTFQFTLTNCPGTDYCPFWLDFWFREGQATVLSGHTHVMISTLAAFREWISAQGHVNPISIHRWQDFPDPDKISEYYPMFALAYRYLTDSKDGRGATLEDIRNLFCFLKDGEKFTAAFAKVFRMTLADFEENFQTLMEEYLRHSLRNIGIQYRTWEGKFFTKNIAG